jgi:hypothetical protein
MNLPTNYDSADYQEVDNLPVLNEDKQTTLVPEQSTMINSSLIDFETFERNSKIMKQIEKIALQRTNPTDWIDEQGKPYLQATGAEKLMSLFGIKFKIDEPVKVNLSDNHYYYTTKGNFYFAGASIEGVIGTKTTKSPFFTNKRNNYDPKAVDETVVKKGAYTNCEVNGVTRILGLRGLTWEYLEEEVGIKKNSVTKIKFDKNKSATTTTNNNQQNNTTIKNGAQTYNLSTTDPATEPQKKAVFAILKKSHNIIYDNDRHKFLSDFLGRQITSMNDLSKHDAGRVITEFGGK